MKLPLRAVLKVIDLGFGLAIAISEALGRRSKKKRFEDLVVKQSAERSRAPTVAVRRRPPPTNRQP